MSSITPFAQLLHTYFHDWLITQRGASRHTILAYRDAWRLFLRFVAARVQQPVARLELSSLTATEILAFLEYLEQDRQVTITTRNGRLAALRSFFTFVADREPLAMAQCAAVLRIPTKRGPRRDVSYLDVDEVTAILAQPDRSRSEGQRDHALLALLYNTGARIQEALDLCPSAIRFGPPAHVRFIGKGQKERLCPLWPETADLLKALLHRQPRLAHEPLFVNRYGRPLGAAGVRYKLKRYVHMAAHQVPSLATKRVTPHVFRHTTAVALVAAGVDVTVIRSWMGHAHLDTTNRYAQAPLETKRAALEQIEPEARPGITPRWKQDDELLKWLESL
jgi:site-specific recombinase XerD